MKGPKTKKIKNKSSQEYFSKTWDDLNLRKINSFYNSSFYNQYSLYFVEECVIERMRNYFVDDFAQLNTSTLTIFLRWYCRMIILIFPKNVFLYFNIAVFLDIGQKWNGLMYIQFTSFSLGMSQILKTFVMEQILFNNNMFNNKYTKTRNEISPSLTLKSNITDAVLESL